MKRQSGQALVLVLLSLAVVLTLVLFILSRSVTDILVSSKSEEAARAFSAAEAGIEQALVIGTGGSNPLGNNSGYVSTVSDYAVGQPYYNYLTELASGDSAMVWFVEHDKTTGNPICDATHKCFTGDTMQVCWGKPETSGVSDVTPAIEVSVFYETDPGNLASIKIARAAYDPWNGRPQSPVNAFSNSLDVSQCPVGSYKFAKTIQFSSLGILPSSYNVENGLQFARVRMFYNTDTTQTIGFNFPGNTTLPSQGLNVVSTGFTCTDANAGNCTSSSNQQSARRLEVFQSWPEPPSVFDNVIYSGSGITK